MVTSGPFFLVLKKITDLCHHFSFIPVCRFTDYIIYEGHLPMALSGARRAREVISDFSVIGPPSGTPSGGQDCLSE
jgi:hypothetical protein